MHRIVFFGMDGPYAMAPLSALASGGLAPVLVVVGRERDPQYPRSTTKIRPAQPGVLERMQAKLRTSVRRAESPHDLAARANEMGIDVVDTDAANERKCLTAIAAAKPDALVVAGFPHLFSKTLLSIPRLGGLNVHPGRLPEERGASPLFWALAEGNETITLTIHMLDAGEDSGDIVATTTVPVEPGVTGSQLLVQLGQVAAPHVVRSTRALLAGDLVRQPQPTNVEVRRRRRPRFRDGRLDPSKSARQVYTFVAALADRYSLFAECGGDRFFIERAISYDAEARCEFEFVLTGDRLVFRCAPGIVELELKEDGALFTAEYEPDEAERALTKE